MKREWDAIVGYRAWVRSIATAAVAGMLAWSCGCGDSSPSARALDRAAFIVKTEGAGPGGAGDRFEKVDAALREVGAGASGGEQAAAALLRASTAQARAAALVTASTTARRRVVAGIDAVLAELGTYEAERARAEARLVFDPAEAIERARAAEGERAAEQAAEEGRLAELVARREGLVQEARGLRARAEGLRRRAAELERSVRSGSATRAAEVAPEVRDLTIEANELERQGAVIGEEGEGGEAGGAAAGEGAIRGAGSRLSSLDSDIAAARARVEQRAEQRRVLMESVERLMELRREAEQRASEHRAAAATAEASIAELLAGVESEMGSGVIGPLSEAVSEAGRALREARAAAGALRVSAGAVRAGASRRLGEAGRALGSAQGELSELLSKVAGAEPPLAGAAQYLSRSEELRGLAQASLTAAAEAYESAAGDIRSAAPRGRGDQAEATAAVFERTARLIRSGLESGGGPGGEAVGNEAGVVGGEAP